MKPVEDYKEIDVYTAVELIRSGDLAYGSQIAVRVDESYEWEVDWLEQIHVFGNMPFETTEDYRWHYAALIIQRMPNEVPEGVPPLPEPWLAYIGQGPLPVADAETETDIWAYHIHSEWFPCGYGGIESVHYAVDVRSTYARENYPELVEAMEYKEPMQSEHKEPLKLELGKWYITKGGTIGQLESNVSECYPYRLRGLTYTKDGHCRNGSLSSDIDHEVKVTKLDGSPINLVEQS